MRGFIFLFCLSLCVLASAFEASPGQPFAADRASFVYRFERGQEPAADILTLRSGAKQIGKVLEWANQVLLFKGDGIVQAYPLEQVEQFELRPGPQSEKKPNLPDLTVAYVERLPRDTHWHGQVTFEDGLARFSSGSAPATKHVKPGDKVTFRVHVKNVGAASSVATPCDISVGKSKAMESSLPILQPDREHVIDYSWTWEEGDHRLKVEIHPPQDTKEICQWNNTFIEDVSGLGITVIVPGKLYTKFQSIRNLVDSYCFEDYIQYHFRNLNALFAASIYPSTPQGALERVRCDQIIISDEGGPNTIAESAGLIRVTSKKDANLKFDVIKVDWTLLQDVCRQLGLVDLTKTDTTIQQCFVQDQYGRYAVRQHISPLLRTLMYTAGGFPLAEHEAAWLNANRTKPCGSKGEYLYRLPAKVAVRVISNQGVPLPGVQVDVFELKAEGGDAGILTGLGGSDPISAAVTDEKGVAPLVDQEVSEGQTPGGIAHRANPFGRIRCDGSNGLLLLRLRSDKAEEFSFLPISACNTAYYRGHTEEFVHDIFTCFAAADAPPSPLYTTTRWTDLEKDRPKLEVAWKFSEAIDSTKLKECRIYKKVGFGGQSTQPWTLVRVVRPVEGAMPTSSFESYFDEFEYAGPFTLDTFFAVSVVDAEGRESNLSPPAYLGYGIDAEGFAIEGMSAVMSARGTGPIKMLYWDGVAGTQPQDLKTRNFPGYVPSFGGIGYLPDHRLIATDPINHVLAIYEGQDAQEIIPSVSDWPHVSSDEKGQFNDPADVTVDSRGNLYVAERGNHRIQVLDAGGGFRAFLDEDFRFRAPHAIAFSNNHVCVTDNNGHRCRVYDVSGDTPKFVRQLPEIFEGGRAIVNKTGQVYISGRSAADGTWGVLIFDPSEKTATLSDTKTQGIMGLYHKPRGLYLYPGLDNGFAYFVNGFPFSVGRVGLEGGD